VRPYKRNLQTASTGAVQQQAVKGNGIGLEGVELDLSELASLISRQRYTPGSVS